MKKGKDFIGVGVGAVILNKDGNILLIKRGPRSQNEIGLWAFPGGAMEFGETFSEAIKREVKEELGVNIKPLVYLKPINQIIKTEKQHWVAVPYICKLSTGKIKIQEEGKISEFGWFSLTDAKKLRASSVAKQIFSEVEEKYNELSDFF